MQHRNIVQCYAGRTPPNDKLPRVCWLIWAAGSGLVNLRVNNIPVHQTPAGQHEVRTHPYSNQCSLREYAPSKSWSQRQKRNEKCQCLRWSSGPFFIFFSNPALSSTPPFVSGPYSGVGCLRMSTPLLPIND